MHHEHFFFFLFEHAHHEQLDEMVCDRNMMIDYKTRFKSWSQVPQLTIQLYKLKATK